MAARVSLDAKPAGTAVKNLQVRSSCWRIPKQPSQPQTRAGSESSGLTTHRQRHGSEEKLLKKAEEIHWSPMVQNSQGRSAIMIQGSQRKEMIIKRGAINVGNARTPRTKREEEMKDDEINVTPVAHQAATCDKIFVNTDGGSADTHRDTPVLHLSPKTSKTRRGEATCLLMLLPILRC